MNKQNYKEIIKNIKLEMMNEFITKVNNYGVRKFQREGINNPELLYQIKNHDESLRIETVEKYLNTINDLMENKK